ncbi:MAG: LytTR family DNA-binding domain-containing protein [Bacteroidetes bacterium]|nr:LytTR family DNA-binding domain-containing protein [Bacteroidota bacterium]
MKINCIVIDDEFPAIEQIEEYISRIPFLNLLKSFDNAIDPINYLKSNQVDLIFLDIEMEGFTGLQLIKTLQHKPKIILTTAYDKYAIEAFDLNVTDYLLKPISFERFIKAIDKVYDSFEISGNNSGNEPVYKRDYFFVKTEFRMQRVDFDDILFIEGMNEYLRINTTKEKIMTLQNFKSLQESLPKDNFIRVHKSYMVAINKIESIEKNRIKIGEKLIPISSTYKEAFFLMLNKN